jgi:hypothetical protein
MTGSEEVRRSRDVGGVRNIPKQTAGRLITDHTDFADFTDRRMDVMITLAQTTFQTSRSSSTTVSDVLQTICRFHHFILLFIRDIRGISAISGHNQNSRKRT